MREKQITITDAASKCVKAYNAHYLENDIHNAFLMYDSIICAYPNTQAARYCKPQVEHFSKTVVPKSEIMEASVKLLHTYSVSRIPHEYERDP
jgi:hypothetical protein